MLSSNKKMMQSHSLKKAIVLLGVQGILEESICNFVIDAFNIFNNYPVSVLNVTW